MIVPLTQNYSDEIIKALGHENFCKMQLAMQQDCSRIAHQRGKIHYKRQRLINIQDENQWQQQNKREELTITQEFLTLLGE